MTQSDENKTQTRKPPQPSSLKREDQPPARPGRRSFLKGLVTAGALATLASYLPFGRFLSVAALASGGRTRIANVKNLAPNSRMIFTYPPTSDPLKEGDPFTKFQLIRLSPENARKAGTEFVAYSMVCVHLWCLWDYKPGDEMMECPCHGSIYEPITGVAIRGPAALQRPPNNALPKVKLEIDERGEIYATGLEGSVGYGRQVK